MNLALRRNIPILLPMFILIGLGWVMVFSTAAALSLHRPDVNVFHHLQRQMLATLIGWAGIMILLRTPFSTLARFTPHLLAAAGLLMLLVFVPGLGKRVGGATRWIDLGRLSFQPVEMLKLAVVLCYAWILSQERAGAAWDMKSLAGSRGSVASYLAA
jgi:cell division protein FtsW